MAIVTYTPKPKVFLNAIYEAIDNHKIVTWKYDKERDFTHTPDQWQNKAWLHPDVSIGILQFGLISEENVPMTKLVYGEYHGRFIEMLLTHFDEYFSTATATALGDTIDDFKTKPRFAYIN